VVDVPSLIRQLELADFVSRQTLAQTAAAALGPGQLSDVIRLLGHPVEKVRLGAIEVLGRAGRDSLAALLGHAQQRTGDDRVFAIRALVHLARPGDEVLHGPARAWLVHQDHFVQAQGRLLARALALPGEAVPAPAPAVAPAPVVQADTETLATLTAALLTARTDSERITLVTALERRGPPDLAASARRALPAGNGDVVALICRALIRQARALPAQVRAELVPLLETARRRFGDWPMALAALDDALIAFEGDTLSTALVLRLGQNAPAQLEGVLRRLHDQPVEQLALQAPVLIGALAQRPALWSALGPLLVDAAPHLREGARAELRARCEAALDELRRGRALDTLPLLSLCWILAQIAEPGWPLCRQLREAVERLGLTEGHRALCALCGRLATEEAAATLVGLSRDPLPEVRAVALEALRSFASPWVAITFVGDEPVVSATYRNAQGSSLSMRDGRLCAPANGDEYALDLRGQPVRASETDHGACLCCRPARALIRLKDEGLRCPASWDSYLREDGRAVLERDHPLGRCRQCESLRPRVREGSRIVCVDCGAGRPLDRAGPEAVRPRPQFPSERGAREDAEALPRPPTAEELAQMAPHIRAAITANVFLLARDGDARWSGSGIIVARDENELAILTNRHVVESEEGRRLAAMRALTAAGELVSAETVWRFGRGVDLAVVTARVEQTAALGKIALGQGAGLVGAPVFAVGNPLGLAWSYSSGTLSAVRHWTTSEGQSVRLLQTDTNIAPGSSGGGLFHGDGHLLGIISFLAQGHAGGSAHFALSVDSIRAALAREDLRWRGRELREWTAD
jgi:S1-C subfamily serine protease